MPITISAQCLACHGARDRLAPGVADALAKLYPKDNATGYDDGDLRGWFWVEVPAGVGSISR
jgi:mono/diheme cytochrome c family protein